MQKGGAPFDLRGCFRLAHVTGTDLVVILKAAEKPEAEIAMIVEVIARCQRTTSTDPVKRGLYEAIDMLRDRGAIETCATLVRYIVGLPPLQPNAPTRASEVSEEARRTGT